MSVEELSVELVIRVLTLQEHNTRLVVISTAILGVAAGLIGSFLLLRKRSLMGDALSHACLPGLALAFLLSVLAGGTGRGLPWLLLGATGTGLIGSALVLVIRNTTRIKDDAAMGIVLSVFFGLGIVFLGFIQGLPQASAAGLPGFIYGKASAMLMADFLVLSGVGSCVLLAALIFRKEFTLLCFDEVFARALGWPIRRLDLFLLLLIAAVTVVGMQTVGLILIIAFLIIPAAAARFWTDDVGRMILLAGGIGGVSGWTGSSLSALLPRLPTGAIIVLVAAIAFLISMLFGQARGILRRYFSYRRLCRKVGRQHLLRAVYETLEHNQQTQGHPIKNARVRFADLLPKRSWSESRLRGLIRQAAREDHIAHFDGQSLTLSEGGYGEAARTTRNHRLWEIYMITHADIAPSHVDRDADSVEHILSPEIVSRLEEKLDAHAIPASPHPITPETRS